MNRNTNKNRMAKGMISWLAVVMLLLISVSVFFLVNQSNDAPTTTQTDVPADVQNDNLAVLSFSHC